MNGLDYERMCLIYSSYLYENLKELSSLAYIIDTTDLGFTFKHRFILVPDINICYLIDLTFKQFLDKSAEFSKLEIDGYQKVDDKTYNDYLTLVTNETIADINLTNSIIDNKKRLGKWCQVFLVKFLCCNF